MVSLFFGNLEGGKVRARRRSRERAFQVELPNGRTSSDFASSKRWWPEGEGEGRTPENESTADGAEAVAIAATVAAPAAS